MAVTAKFVGDFSNFTAAVEKAEQHLVDLEKGANKVSGQLGRMQDALSGRKLVQDAILSAEAVERIGGMSKLTEAELRKLQAQATEASAKLRAMGRDVPPGIQQIVDTTKKLEPSLTMANRATGLLKSTFGQMFAALSATAIVDRVVGGFVSLARGAIESAGSLVDLSNKTGLSIETLQRMQFVAKQSGSDANAFADAVFKMGVNISKGTGVARNGAEILKLSWEKLREASPDDQFRMVVEALERMEDPQKRNEAALALFGKTAAGVIPAIVDGYSKMAGQAKVASDAQVRALDAASDAWDRFVERQKSSLTGWLGNMVIARDQVGKLTAEQQAQYAAILKSGGDAHAFLLKIAEQATKTGKDIHLATPKPIPPSFTESLKAAESGYRSLSSAQRAEIESALRLNKSNDDIINQLGVTEGVLNIAKKAFQDHESAVKRATTAKEANAKAAETLRLAYLPLTEEQELAAISAAEMGVSAETTAKVLGVSAVQVTKYVDAFKAAKEAGAVWVKAHEAISDASDKFIRKQIKDWNDAQLKIADASSLALADQLDAYADYLERNYQFTLTAGQRTIRNIELERDSAIGALTKRFDIQSEMYRKASDEIERFYAREIAAAKKAQGTLAGTIVSEFLGAFTGAGGFLQGLKNYGSKVATDFTAGILSAIPGIGPALAEFAGPLVEGFKALFGKIAGMFDRNKGRDIVEDFAKGFGGFDTLHKELNALGAEGENLWIKLTQGVGRNNKDQARAAVEEVTAALEKHKTAQEAVKTAAEQATEAQIAGYEQAKDALKTLDDQIKSLEDSIAGEAPEEFMGIVEMQTRARIATLKAEREEAQRGIEALTGTMTDSIRDVADAIRDLPKEIAIRLNVESRFGGEEGGRVIPFASGGRVPKGTDTVPAMLTPGEIVLNAAQQRNVAGSIADDGLRGELQALRQNLEDQQLRADADRVFLLVQLPKAIAEAVQRGAA